MATNPIYLEIVDFFASGTTPQAVVEFQPSAAARERALELLELSQRRSADSGTGIRVEHFTELEHVLRMAEASCTPDPCRSAVTWPEAVRKLIQERASNRCEYCLLDQAIQACRHEIDHVISRKHRGSSAPENLSFAVPL